LEAGLFLLIKKISTPSPPGRATPLFNSPEIRKAVLALLREKRVPHLIVNMLEVPYVDSSGVASLVEALKVARDVNSRLSLYGLSKSAKTVLELTHLIRVFEVHQTEQQALEAPPSASPQAGSVKANGETA